MDTQPHIPIADQFAAACEWWRDAGVDFDFHDAPQALLKEPEAEGETHDSLAPQGAPATVAPEEPPPPSIDRAALPTNLADFAAWWTSGEVMEFGGTGTAIAPRGEEGAKLMIIVPMPETGDTEQLLSGPQGQLLRNVLRAMQIPETETYLTSALPRHMPVPDWKGLGSKGLGTILRHHISLAKPQGVLVFGRDVLTLLDHRKGDERIDLVDDASVRVLGSFALDRLLENPRLRADLWRRWLDWTDMQ